MTIPRQPTRARIKSLGDLVLSIERKQEARPGYNQDILEAIVNGELNKLAAEQARFERQEAKR